jgi:hypothetical protein
MRTFITIALGIALLTVAQTAVAADPSLPYQGRLLDALGQAINTEETLTVSLYTDQDGTTDVWRKAYPNVSLEDGYFSIDVYGTDTTGRPLATALGTASLWVGVSIDGSTDMEPRNRLASVPHAQVAAELSGDLVATNLRPGMVLSTQHYTDQTHYSANSTSWSLGPTFTYDKQAARSHLFVNGAFPYYIALGNSGYGLRLQWSLDNSTWNNAHLTEGPANGWGAGGYGGNDAGITPYVDYLTAFASHTGTVYLRFQYRKWNTDDTLFFISHSSYTKRATWVVQEIAQ